MIKKKFNYKNVVMIGDGATDLESSPPAVIINLYILKNFQLIEIHIYIYIQLLQIGF